MDDFNFYLKFAKPLVLNLPDAKDRTTAALWVKKLRAMESDGPEANMRIEYLKLLLFVMQRNKLAGIFEQAPPDGPLQGFPPNYKVPRSIVVEDDNLKIRFQVAATDMLSLVKPRKAALPVYPPVFTSVGGDLCQFVAVQEIPNFGLHGYYAISMEPLSKWSHASTNTAKKVTMKPKHYAECFKNSCKLVESTYCPEKSSDQVSPSSPPSESPATQDQQPRMSQRSSKAPVNSKNTDPSENRKQQNECEKIPGPTTQFVQLPPIPFQSFRKEIAGFESRPTWGRSRYIERLIDESPHLAADLDVSQADAMLNVMSDKKFKKVDDNGPCAISNNRRHVERMLDLPPCAVDLGEIKRNSDSCIGTLYTCCPKKEKIIETHTDICLSKSDFYPCGKRSGMSLRGGSDSGGCCSAQNRRSRSRTSSESRNNDAQSHQYYTSEFPRSRQRNETSRNGSIFYDTDDPLDVDTSIHNTTTANKYIDPDTSGNFKWLEDMEHIILSDPTEMSIAESDFGARMRPYSSDTMTNEFNALETEGCSELDEEIPINEELQPGKLMPQVAPRMQSSKVHHSRRSPSFQQQPQSRFSNVRSYTQDNWEQQMGMRNRNRTTVHRDNCEEEDEPSMAVLRRRLAKSREATKRNPEIHEKSYRWKEIIDQTEPSRDQSLRSRGAPYTSNVDLEYLDYIEAIKTDRGCCYEDDDEELERPRYTRRPSVQILDADTAQYTKKLLKPPKALPSPGRVTMPLSKQNQRRRKAEEQMQFEQRSDVNIDADESK